MTRTRLGLMAVLTIGALVAGAAVAGAQQKTEEFLGGKLRTGDAVNVPVGETVDGDLYAIGGSISINGDVTGDVVAIGGQVDITGTVGGDLIATSGTVDVTGSVLGDVRVGAGQVTLSGSVGEDALVAAGQTTVSGTVGQDLIFGVGRMSLRGSVSGSVLGGSGQYEKTGTIGGSEDVSVGEQEAQAERRSPVARALARFAAVFLFGLVLLVIKRRRWVDETVAGLTTSPGPSAGYGAIFLAALLVVPFATLLLGILLSILFGWLGLGLLVGLTVLSMIAIWAGLALVAFEIIAFLAPITVGVWLAQRIMADTTPAYLLLAAGLAVLVILGLIPIVGFLVGLAVTVLGAGTWLRTVLRRRGKVEPAMT